MSTKATSVVIEQLIDPLGRCLTPEVARRVLKLRADPQLQAIVDRLAEKSDEGTLTAGEQAEYSNYVSFGTFVALLKSKARQLLSEPPEIK